jgi:hypothetical protein
MRFAQPETKSIDALISRYNRLDKMKLTAEGASHADHT